MIETGAVESVESVPRRSWVLVLFLAAFAAYAGWFIWRSSFVVESERHFCLVDDAMVSMRFARNLAAGEGAVWNPGGERVEGVTNPLWMLYMALLHRLPLPPSKVSLAVQLTGALLLLLNLLYVGRIANRLTGESRPAVAAALLLTGFYYPINHWGMTGLEVGLLTALTTATVWRMIRMVDAGRWDAAPLGLMGVAVLVRLDMALLLVATQGLLFLQTPSHRRRIAWTAAVALAVTAGLPTLARYAYYGDWLPNTYHLKMGGYPVLERLRAGAAALWRFGWGLHPVAWLAALWNFRPGADRRAGLALALPMGCQALYSVYTGGDAFDDMGGSNRFLTVAMPAFFVLVAAGLDHALAAAWERLNRRRTLGAWLRPALLVTGCALLLFQINRLDYFRRADYWLLTRPLGWELEHQAMVSRALWIREHTDPPATIAVVWAGIIPYFADRTALDLLGKCDRHIARQPMHRRPFWPGHLKWDYAYALGERRPDVIVQLWWVPEGVRATSPGYILLDEIPPDAWPWIEGKYDRLDTPTGAYLVNRGFRNLTRLRRELGIPANDVRPTGGSS
jgi:hypothetical protein